MDHYSNRFEHLVNIAIKFSILVIITAITSIVAPLSIYVFGVRPSIACATDMVINIICLYMQFNVGNALYIKLFGKLHQLMAKIIILSKMASNSDLV